MKMNTTDYQVYGNHLAIEKYQKRQREMKLLAVVSFFAAFIIMMPTIINNSSEHFVDAIIYWIITFALAVVAFVFDSKYAKKIKEFELKNFEIETEAMARKIKVAEIRKEKLLDYEINKRIKAPDPEVIYPYRFYIVIAFLYLILGILFFSSMLF